MKHRKAPVFPRLNQQEMADFLTIKRVRLQWATREGIVERSKDGYCPEVVTGQWLSYERGRMDKKAHRSEFERERIRLTRAKAEAAERQLAVLDGSLLGTDDIVQSVKTVCLRIKSKLQAALPRLTRACYHAPSLTEATKNSRVEFDLLISELSGLENGAAPSPFEVVEDENRGSVKRSASRKSPERSAH